MDQLTSQDSDVTRRYAREQTAAALQQAKNIVEGITGTSPDLSWERDQVKARLLIDIASEWRWLHDDLPC